VTNVLVAGYVGSCGNIANGHLIHVRVAEKLTSWKTLKLNLEGNRTGGPET